MVHALSTLITVHRYTFFLVASRSSGFFLGVSSLQSCRWFSRAFSVDLQWNGSPLSIGAGPLMRCASEGVTQPGLGLVKEASSFHA